MLCDVLQLLRNKVYIYAVLLCIVCVRCCRMTVNIRAKFDYLLYEVFVIACTLD